jgi:type II secretory pathway pseudopilin PulG
MMPTTRDESGFSLIETVVAMGILATGLLGLAGVFTLGIAHMATSSANLVAREKAREAVESVHTARDAQTPETAQFTWARINNDSVSPGVFLSGPQPLYKPGPDGLVNTADDDDNGAAGLEVQRLPGPDGILGNSDDVTVSMTNYTRTIAITPLNEVKPDGTTGVNANLRQITVTIAYSVGPVKRTYVLTTYISAIS